MSGAFTWAKGLAYKPLVNRISVGRSLNRIGFSQRLELRQTQALVMTPQLQQAIKMLQLSNLELSDLVDAEIEQNPLLELGERESDDAPPVLDLAPAPASERPASLTETPHDEFVPDAAEQWQASAGTDGDGSADFGGDSLSWRNTRSGSFAEDGLPGYEDAAAQANTLREHLLEQIGPDLPDQADRVIAVFLLDQVDETGYLRGAVDEAADRLGCDLSRVERVLAQLQEFDPPGVFARSLPECLALQLRDRNRLDPAMQALLDNLPLVAARNRAALMRV